MHSYSRNLSPLFLLFLGPLWIAGCAAGGDEFTAEDPAGFWMGLWHGLISCIALVLGIFYESVEIYERNNSGGWYDLGFLIGIAVLGGTGHQSGRKWGRRTSAKELLSSAHIPSKGSARFEVSWDSEEDDENEDDDKDELD